VSKTVFWKLLLDSKKLDLRIYIYIYANQCFRVSQTALKTAVFESQKDMFLSLKKASKRVTFWFFFSLGALSFLEVQKSTKVTETYIYIRKTSFFESQKQSKKEWFFSFKNISFWASKQFKNSLKMTLFWFFL